MQKRTLGQTEIEIAPLVFSGNVFGWTADRQRSFDLLDRFGAVPQGFEGVTAREWLAVRRELRGADPQGKIHDRKIVMRAMKAIRERSTSATTLAGLIAEDRSPERIRQEENRLFIGFSVAKDRPALPIAADGIGRSIPHWENHYPAPDAPETRPAPDDVIAARVERAPNPHPNPIEPEPAAGSWKITV